MSPADITALCKVQTPLANQLVNKVALNMANRSWKAELPNEAAFAAYLLTNERFGSAFNALYTKWKATQQSHEAFLGREAARQVKAEQSRKVKAEREQERRKRDAKGPPMLRHGLRLASQSVREKMRHAGSKYTSSEARYVWNTFDKRVLVAPGKYAVASFTASNSHNVIIHDCIMTAYIYLVALQPTTVLVWW